MGINQPGAGKQGGLGTAEERGPLDGSGTSSSFILLGFAQPCSACEMFSLKDPAVRWVKNILLSQELAEILVNLQKYVFVGAACSVRRTSINYASRKPFSWNEVLTVLRALSGRLCWEWSFAGKHVSTGEAQGGKHRAPAPLPHRQTPHQAPAVLQCSNRNLWILKLQKNPIDFFFCPLKACLPCHPSPSGCGWTSPNGVSTKNLTMGICPHPTSLSSCGASTAACLPQFP